MTDPINNTEEELNPEDREPKKPGGSIAVEAFSPGNPAAESVPEGQEKNSNQSNRLGSIFASSLTPLPFGLAKVGGDTVREEVVGRIAGKASDQASSLSFYEDPNQLKKRIFYREVGRPFERMVNDALHELDQKIEPVAKAAADAYNWAKGFEFVGADAIFSYAGADMGASWRIDQEGNSKIKELAGFSPTVAGLSGRLVFKLPSNSPNLQGEASDAEPDFWLSGDIKDIFKNKKFGAHVGPVYLGAAISLDLNKLAIQGDWSFGLRPITGSISADKMSRMLENTLTPVGEKVGEFGEYLDTLITPRVRELDRYLKPKVDQLNNILTPISQDIRQHSEHGFNSLTDFTSKP